MAATPAQAQDSSVPRDALAIQSILKDMGVTEYEPAVVNQLLEFCYRYTTDILDDAKAFSSHANKKSIDIEDTKLSVQLKLEKSYTNPPPRELLLDIASHKNSQSLPLMKPYTGPKLPPDRYCLTSMNYQLRRAKKPQLNYSTHSIQVPYQRQLSHKTSLLSQPQVGKQLMTQPGAAKHVAVRPNITVIPSTSLTTAPLNTGIDISQGVKRKLEPEDDYDA